ncbi:2-oxo-4-hydroxy-4-carboxy-5-ureidoimidazoline decarboxylase [Marinomonas algicola]|uniref:2-oxo-4-hydroxy-4-carboxy-5-ureidoimidazoline decarboxylase n=1 Tax=Marinomonas algicola TaxID=2773454 RepID=UPI00174EB70B|nr:2-oxo-4-hydroxy-4-carboxy-5-ureidoimidazoline decarboxylase [Marinomonas algicola]
MKKLKNKPSELSYEGFIEVFRDVYEHSSWVAEAAWEFVQRADQKVFFDDIDAMANLLKEVVNNSRYERKLALLNAHPDLAGKAALSGSLTADSANEQAGAGLDSCTKDELARFHQLNTCYKQKNGFPFIMAVKGATKHQVLQGFDSRIKHDTDQEFLCAVSEVHKIAMFRLEDK